MATVSVSPEEFSYVVFDAGRIAAIAEKLAEQLGFAADERIEIVIDEKVPLNRTKTASAADPVRFEIEGGALEDPQAPRHLGERSTVAVVGRLLCHVMDRRGKFADAPADEALTLAQQVAWDTTIMGRLSRLGYDTQQPRRRYHFRNRHGFTDLADQLFDRLWQSDDPSWADIEAACAATDAVRQPA